MSEVKGDSIIQAGDKVEFVVVHHQKTGKYSACSVVKIGYEIIFFRDFSCEYYVVIVH